MKARLLGVCLAICLAVASPVSVLAAEFQGKVYYNGSKLVSDFTSNDITKMLNDMQPGDSTEIKVKATNSVDKETDWYFSNQVIESLEDSKKASQGAYTYKLSYTGSDGTNVLYDSTIVGGADKTGGVGLHQADSALKDYFYLDRLGADESGVVTLVVALDGETQGNAYQSTRAQVRMSFGVEELPEESKPKKKPVVSPKTGDTSSLMTYSMITLAAGILLMLLVIFRVLTNKRIKEDE